MRNQRIQWIDSAKGFGILLVVYAHLFEFGTSLIYLFHMPLFFILFRNHFSGRVFNRLLDKERA